MNKPLPPPKCREGKQFKSYTVTYKKLKNIYHGS